MGVGFTTIDCCFIYQGLMQVLRKFDDPLIFEFAGGFGVSTQVILRAMANTGKGKLITAELEPTRISGLTGLCAGKDAEVWGGDLTQRIDLPEKIDFLLHDTAHDEKTIIWSLENLWPRVSWGGAVYVHDVNPNHSPHQMERNLVLNYLKNRSKEWVMIDIGQLKDSFLPASGGMNFGGFGWGFLCRHLPSSWLYLESLGEDPAEFERL